MQIQHLWESPTPLLEYDQAKTISAFGEKLLARAQLDPSLKQYTRNLDSKGIIELVVAALEKADPTPHKEYVQWLARAYIMATTFRLEDVLTRGYATLTMFNTLKLKKKLPLDFRDINKVRTIVDLERMLDPYTELAQAPSQSVNKGKFTEFFNGSQVRVIIPHDEAAAKYYGRGTKWCTAADNHNAFSQYAADGDLYIVLPKRPSRVGEKYQIQFALVDSGDDHQIMDETDEPVNFFWLVSTYPELFDALKVPATKAKVALYDSIPRVNEAEVSKLKKRMQSEVNALVSVYLRKAIVPRVTSHPFRPANLAHPYPAAGLIGGVLRQGNLVNEMIPAAIDLALASPSYGLMVDGHISTGDELLSKIDKATLEDAERRLTEWIKPSNHPYASTFALRVLRAFAQGVGRIVEYVVHDYVEVEKAEPETQDYDRWYY